MTLPTMLLSARIRGETLARAQARSGDRIRGETLARAHALSVDSVAIAACLGKKDDFDRSIADVTAAYAAQNAQDFAAFAAAVASGRLTASSDG